MRRARSSRRKSWSIRQVSDKWWPEPFGQPDGLLPPHSPTIGLGLYVSRQLAEGHGGSLVIESSTADGTTFALALPLSMTASTPVVTVAGDPSEASPIQVATPTEALTRS